MTTYDRLVALVEAEHAAVYGYGVLGARLDDAGRRFARTAYDSHRARRDALIAALSGKAPVPLASYDVAVADAAEAMALAVRIETGMSLRWRDLVGGTDERALRSLGIAGLQETAVRAAQWRKRAGLTPATVALPGTG
jgi:hypothetical protein